MVMQRRIDDCCIGDTIEYQEGDTPQLTVKRSALSYQPLPSQLRTWGRVNRPYKFRLNNEGVLVRYE